MTIPINHHMTIIDTWDNAHRGTVVGVSRWASGVAIVAVETSYAVSPGTYEAIYHSPSQLEQGTYAVHTLSHAGALRWVVTGIFKPTQDSEMQ